MSLPRRICRARRIIGQVLALAVGCWESAGYLPAADPRAQPQTQIEIGEAALVKLLAQRLDIAREVAWTKFHTGASIYDPAREAAIIQDFAAKAAKDHLAPSAATAFFAAQIAASRQVQAESIKSWKAGGPRPGTKPLDLKKDIRPQLDQLSERLLAVLAADPGLLSGSASSAFAEASLRASGFSPTAAKLAAAGFTMAPPPSDSSTRRPSP